MEKISGFQLKNDRDYIIMPITGSDLVAFDSNPSDYYEYMRTNHGSGWEYKATVTVKDKRCLLWGRWDDK